MAREIKNYEKQKMIEAYAEHTQNAYYSSQLDLCYMHLLCNKN